MINDEVYVPDGIEENYQTVINIWFDIMTKESKRINEKTCAALSPNKLYVIKNTSLVQEDKVLLDPNNKRSKHKLN